MVKIWQYVSKTPPHQMSTVTISMINGEECNFEYADIDMDDAKAENNFIKFLEFYFDAI